MKTKELKILGMEINICDRFPFFDNPFTEKNIKRYLEIIELAPSEIDWENQGSKAMILFGISTFAYDIAKINNLRKRSGIAMIRKRALCKNAYNSKR